MNTIASRLSLPLSPLFLGVGAWSSFRDPLSLSGTIGPIWVWVYYGLVILNAVVAITCFAVGRKLWAQLLCGTVLQANWVLIVFFVFGLAEASAGELFGLDAMQLFKLMVPVVIESVVLGVVCYWRLAYPVALPLGR